jgi:2-dehydro-3-deoxygluconokinase
LSTNDLEVVTVGEPLVAMVASPPGVSLADAQSFSVHVVGAESNVAVGLARLGHQVGFVGRVGRDPFGELVRRRLMAEGVDVSGLTDDDRPTGLLFRNLRNLPAPEVLYRRAGSAGSALEVSDALPALKRLPRRGLVLLSGVTAAVCPQTATEIASVSQANGLRLVLDVNYRARLWSPTAAVSTLTSILKYSSLLVGTAEEVRLLASLSDVDAAATSLLRSGPEVVVVREKKVQARFYRQDGISPVVVAGHEAPVVDAVGAGDAFLAGLLSGLLGSDFRDPEGSLRRAHQCGAAVVGAVGDIEAALRRHELRNMSSDEPLR